MKPGGSTIALPGALLFLAGLAIIYFTLRWRDEKHGTFGGFFTGTETDMSLVPPDATPSPGDGTNVV
jgi:hypothetical protein